MPTNDTPTKPTVQFTSSLGLIIAALGMAIGTGNIWRFPRIMAQNEGGTFLIPWAIFLFTWSIPLLMVEFGLGRTTRRGPVGAFVTMFGKRSAFMGWFVAMCTILIMFYYSVVSGWCLRYLAQSVMHGFGDMSQQSSVEFFNAGASGTSAVIGHAITMLIATGVVFLGVIKGIERVCRVLIPTLLVIVIIAAIRAISLPGSAEGLSFMFSVNWSSLASHKVWLEGLSQSAWSTGAGWGLLLCYAIYAPRKQKPAPTCAATGIGNNTASLIAALGVVPAIFALMPMLIPEADGDFIRNELQQSGPALTGVTFVWLPILLQDLTVFEFNLGRWPNVAFFLSLSFAAISSMIAMVELSTRLLMDLGLTRKKAVIGVAAGGFAFGLPSALSQDVFANQDWVWGLGLILSGGFLTYGVIRYGVRRFRNDCLTVDGSGPGRWFDFAVGILIPIQFVSLMVWWFYQAFTWTNAEDSMGKRLMAWLNPMDGFSVGTCLAQWGVLLAIGLVLNRWLAAAGDRESG